MSKQATSAVEGMSVSDMRKLLAEFRSLMSNQTQECPFTLNDILSNDQYVWQFAVDVALGIHEKRTKSTKSKKT